MILTLDTSSGKLSCGLFNNDKTIFEFSTNVLKKQLSLLVPTIKYFFEKFNIKISDIQLIAITIGPGSFTGIRLGLATVKTLSQITEVKIAPVSTLYAIARNIVVPDVLICPIIDARKKELYSTFFEYTGEEYKQLSEEKTYSPEELSEKCNLLKKSLKKDIIFTGDGIKNYKEVLLSSVKNNIKFADEFFWYPKNYYIHKIAKEKLQKEEILNWYDVKPVYLRKQI